MLRRELWEGEALPENSVSAFLDFLQEAIDDFRRPHMHYNHWRYKLGSAVGWIESTNPEKYEGCKRDWFFIRDHIYHHKHQTDDNLYFEDLSEYLTKRFKKWSIKDPFRRRLAAWQRLSPELSVALKEFPNPAWENWIVGMYLDGVHWEQIEKERTHPNGKKNPRFIDPDSESITWLELARLLEGGKERE